MVVSVKSREPSGTTRDTPVDERDSWGRVRSAWISTGGSLTDAHVALGDQLVVEVAVRDLERSLALYTALGFSLERRDGHFAVLRYGTAQLFLDQRAGLSAPDGPSRANVRILVPDVDRLWAVAHNLGLPIEQAIGDRYYGLRDFTVLDPDGFGLRFASWLPVDASHRQHSVIDTRTER